MPHGTAPHGPAADDTCAPDPDIPGSAEYSAELSAISAAFPTLRWQSATRIEEGWDHVVVMCQGCEGPDSLGHHDLVFRFPTDEQALAQLPTEIRVLDHLAGQVDAALPRYTHIPGGGGFAGYPLVRGERLTPQLLHSLPLRERTTVAGQLGALLSAMHIQDLSLPPMNRVPPSYQPENLDFVRGIVEHTMPDVLTSDELYTAREICDEVAVLQSTLQPRVFLHYDIHPRHLYWERGSGRTPGRLGLIDFTDMCVGDPAVDFAELYEYGPRFVEDVLARYVGRIDTGFLDRAWTYQRFAGLYLIAAHLYYGEETWAHARATFDRCRSARRPIT